MAQRPALALRPARTAAILAVALLVVSVLAFSWSHYLCFDAVYACPANGCGDIPQENCKASFTFALCLLGIGTALAALAISTLIRFTRPGHRLPAREVV